MTSDAVKVARIQAKAARDARNAELLSVALKSPIVQFLGGTLIVESLFKAGFFNEKQRDFGGTAVTVIAGLNALAPTLPYLSAGVGGVVKAIGTTAVVGSGLTGLA